MGIAVNTAAVHPAVIDSNCPVGAGARNAEPEITHTQPARTAGANRHHKRDAARSAVAQRADGESGQTIGVQMKPCKPFPPPGKLW